MSGTTSTPVYYVAEEWISRRHHWKRWLFQVDVKHVQVGDHVMVRLFMSDIPTNINGSSALHEATPRKVRAVKQNEEFNTVSIRVRHYIFRYWHTFLHPEEQVFIPAADDTRGGLIR